MIAAVIGWQQAVGLLRIAHRLIKIDDCVEVAGCANPLIDRLAVSLAAWAGMVVVRSCIRCNRCAYDTNAMGMSADNQLLIRAKNTMDEQGMFRWRYLSIARQAAKIVDSFKDDQPVHTGLGKYIAVKACQRIRAEAIGKKMIASDALIQNADVSIDRGRLQPLCENISPAVISIGGGRVPVCDGISQRNDRGTLWRSKDIDARYLIPVVYLVGIRQRCGRD